jgi:hypothetical protein
VDALHAVIQQAWTGETLPRSWTEGVLCPVYKRLNDVRRPFETQVAICCRELLTNNVLSHANTAVQHYQAGFQSGKSTTDQLFALGQILEKSNEFITQRIISS